MAFAKPTKAIIPAAGIGTRFLPLTKAMPKEMLPIIDKPVIQIVVENLVAAGIKDIIIVTGYTKRPVEDHFDRSEEFEAELRARGKNEQADQIQAIAEMANFVYVRQKGTPKGNARPLLNVAHLLSDNEPFFLLFGDEYVQSDIPWTVQLLETYEKTGGSVVSMVEVPKEDTYKYGIASVEPGPDAKSFKIKDMVEKPDVDKAPSNFACNGGYLLTPDIMPYVRQEKTGKGGEIVLLDSINELAHIGKAYGCLIDGKYQDAGDKSRYLEAIIDQAWIDPDLGEKFKNYVRDKINQ
jgi:UTP--glucose-1-phosphate uridylyltransferase